MNEVVPLTLPLRDSQPTDTSGTVGATVVDTITVIERAAARCGKKANMLSAEDLDTAKTNLFLILSKLANRGLNLWAVEQLHLSVLKGKARYDLPPATQGIVRVMYRSVRRLAATPLLAGATAARLTFTSMTPVVMFGFKLPAELTTSLAIETTINGIDWVEVQDFGTLTLSEGWHWYNVDPSATCTGIRLRDTADNLITVTDMVASSYASDQPLLPLNRDGYTDLNDKFRTGNPSTFYFEKKIESAVSFWPVPDDELGHFVLWRHRSVQDVGTLSGRLEVPDRWIDAIIWMLAKNLAVELDGVTPDRIQICAVGAQEAQNDAELGESDGSPMYLRPNISGYTV